jgi:hypothetical protein
LHLVAVQCCNSSSSSSSSSRVWGRQNNVKPNVQQEEEEATTNVNRERDSTLVICCQWSQAWSCSKGEEGAVAPSAFWVAKVGCSYGVRRYVMGSVYLGL